MALKVGTKGDIITFGDDEYRLERVAIVNPEGTEAVNPALAGDGESDEPAPLHYKLYKRVDNETGTDENDNDCYLTAEGKPTTYTYRFDFVGDVVAVDDDTAISEAKSLISAEG